MNNKISRRAFLGLAACVTGAAVLYKNKDKVEAVIKRVPEALSFDGVGAHFDGAWYFDGTGIPPRPEKYETFIPFINKE